MKKTISLSTILLLVVSSCFGNGYKPVSEGHWPFHGVGYTFNPSVTKDWSYTTNEGPTNYKLYFYYTGNENEPGTNEGGGIQMIMDVPKFAATDQFISYVNGKEDLLNDANAELVSNSIIPDSKYGKFCARFSRKFRLKQSLYPNGMEENIIDEGYYFLHPNNPHYIYKIHLFKKGVGAASDSAFGRFMEDFYIGFHLSKEFSPTWSLGAMMQLEIGVDDGLDFGFVDSQTNQPIRIDPGAGSIFVFSAYRKIKSRYYVGTKLGYAHGISSLSGIYSNIEGTTSKGFTAEVLGGALFFSPYRHRLLLSAGPSFYSSPAMDLKLTDNGNVSTASFLYKPIFGVSLGGYYIFVLKKGRGQFFCGYSYHFNQEYYLRSYVQNGVTYDPSALIPEMSRFKNVNANCKTLVMFGYHLNFN